MELYDGGVTQPRGFSAIGICAGIKKDRKDMAMIMSSQPCTLAGTFTQNIVKASPVVWDKNIVHEYKIAQACVMNSGVANACTGKQGDDYCLATAQAAADALDLRPEQVLLASTGVIGRQLPIEKICEGVKTMSGMLSDSRQAAMSAAEAIMTTDTKRKEIAVTFELAGKEVTIGGMTKGAGMIHPNMGTMLCFLTTDAAISADMAQKALLSCVQDSFNMISVDGDQSTNDTCVLLANALAGNPEITQEGEDYEIFRSALELVTKNLARRMAADGEGAHALFEVTVTGASSKEQAVVLAKSVIESSLVKTAIAGHDANWGRIICAMGYSGAVFDTEKVDLTFSSRAGSVKIAENSVDTGYSEELATKILSEDEITAIIDIHEGKEMATAWGCDLTHEYISINADYRS
ncbi:MAG: bifunctional glutamate N-acetyltransferase/amino-acid acetyltransferase ArgJ [Selenomonas sp.]|uniref:bifunctional glutamate N-acetyltransferase/amino-acid acetyltransferase ArgJ n=1 Tax=Selenomonas sp. TaxID=2053611 RepID=UPI0025F17C88|nr:bifunctional glutamate N-acetyltransferase/amino-acid acetyltransferase ArgJ [Selenomonas sp.]MCR5439091.1 bifunctional glutamate N-acetyltransferase/amino-acid acetyltransferase ArgJ [Selenomonas sp.]